MFKFFDIFEDFIKGQSNPTSKKPKEIKTTETIKTLVSWYTGDTREEIDERLKENSSLYRTLKKNEALQENPINGFFNSYKIEGESNPKVNLKFNNGAIVFCGLLNTFEHSGIYIDNSSIIELNGDGKIRKVSVNKFLTSSELRNNKLYTFVNKNNIPICTYSFSQRAEKMLNSCRNYNVIFDNCHQFTSGCITNNFENADNAFWMLKTTIEQRFGCEIFIREVEI